MTDDDESEPTYNFVLPFIACVSLGGPYDDRSFAAGYQIGTIDQEMKDGSGTLRATIQGPLVKQLDLFAMHRGWVLTVLGGPEVAPDDEDWVQVELVRQDDRDPNCVAAWPECSIGGYDPRCCRFPKSCSCWRPGAG